MFFSYLGGVVAVLNLLWFAYRIIQRKVTPGSIASWLLFFSLDSLILGATWIAGQPIGLPLGYTIGAGSVTASLLFRGVWSWSKSETLCAVCTAAAALIWFRSNASRGVFFGSVAMATACIPLLINMIQRPVRATWPVWFWTVVSGVLTLIGSDWTVTGPALAWVSIVLNALLMYFVLRGAKQ